MSRVSGISRGTDGKVASICCEREKEEAAAFVTWKEEWELKCIGNATLDRV